MQRGWEAHTHPRRLLIAIRVGFFFFIRYTSPSIEGNTMQVVFLFIRGCFQLFLQSSIVVAGMHAVLGICCALVLACCRVEGNPRTRRCDCSDKRGCFQLALQSTITVAGMYRVLGICCALMLACCRVEGNLHIVCKTVTNVTQQWQNATHTSICLFPGHLGVILILC